MAAEEHSQQHLETAAAPAGHPAGPVAPASPGQSRSAERQILLYQVLRAVGGQFDPDAVMRLAVRAIDEFSGWEHICLAALDAGGTHWEIRAAGGALAGQVGTAYRLNQGVIGQVFTTGQPFLLRDADVNEDYEPGHAALSSELAVPIKHGGRVTCVLNLESDRADAFDAGDVLTAGLLADAIALALDNARLYTEARHELAERQRAEEQLRASLQEKDVLLKEVHHRVKNNLQVVSSLLNLQSRAVHDPQVLSALRDSQGRVRTMGLIHERLYQSQDLSKVDFAEYMRSLVIYLFNSYGMEPVRVSLVVDVPAGLTMGVDVAIPCGLIVNELVSNAFKHAFPGGRTGTLRVELAPTGDGNMRLLIADDGIGLPEGFDLHSTQSLGLKLVASLTSELGGHLEAASTGGAVFSITFPVQGVKEGGAWKP